MTTNPPTATKEEETTVGGYRLRVYELDDGRRVVHKDDFETILANIGTLKGEELEEIARFCRRKH